MVGIKEDLYIFLDIDGVLNNEEYFTNRHEPKKGTQWFSGKLVDMFNDMCDQIQAKYFNIKIVLSSSHRMGLNHEQSSLYLKENGITHECVGRTKYIGLSQFEAWEHVNVPRGLEVDEYVTRNKIDHYIILDDDGDFLLKQKENFFQTDGYLGLTDDIINDIISYCNRIINENNKEKVV